MGILSRLKSLFHRGGSGDNVNKDIASEIEHVIDAICERTKRHSWDENHISYLLVEELGRLLSDHRVHFKGWSKVVRWQAYKNKGKIENAHGDIALLLNIQFSTKEVLRGVAFLEAKREYEPEMFGSLKLEQVDDILANTPYSQLLLYYRDKLKWPVKWPGSDEWESHMWISPLNSVSPLLRQLAPRHNGKVQRICLPFSMFLTARAFWGLDLDYRQELYDNIAFANQAPDAPDFLAVIDIYYDGQAPLRTALGVTWERI